MKYFYLIAIVFLTSCSLIKPTPIAYHCPRIILPADPKPNTDKLTEKSKPNEVIKAWVSTAMAYRDWNRIVRKQIENSN